MSEGQPPTPPQHVTPPISQPFPGSLTPGWNDPPSIQYNPTSGATPGRTKLNKRVPFPLQQSSTTTKPTAIVQPCMGQQPMGITGTSGNIAVVHPLQHTNVENTASTSMLPPVAGLSVVGGIGLAELPTTVRESSQIQTQTQSDVTVPTMFVPAVPRQPDTTSQSTVQHL